MNPAEEMFMFEQTDFSSSTQRMKLSILIAATISALFAFLLFVGASFGSEFAMQGLINLSLPKFNVFANFIPDDLSQVSYGLQMTLGVIILQWALVLSIMIFAAWSFLRKR